VAALAAALGVAVTRHCSHTLYDPRLLLAAAGGDVPKARANL
jgi:hypothetical protein